MDWLPVPGTYVRDQNTGLHGVVTDVRQVGTSDGWALVEVRSGPGDDEVFCSLARDLRISVVGPPI